jgi:hypothetical protein
MISSKNSYALFNRGTIKIPSPVNSPVRPWKRESFFSHALDVKTVLAVSRESITKSTVPLVRLDFPMQGLGDLNRACAFRQTR